MERTNQVIIIIGRRKCGKTVFGRKIIDTSKFNKILVVDTFEHPDYSDFQTITADMLPRWKSGKKRILYRTDEDMQAINEHVKNTLIVMEDCTKYITGDMSKPVKGIVFDSKQKNNDVLLMYHGFSFAPPKLLANVNYITLFKMGEAIHRSKSKIPNYETILEGYKIIKASNNPFINKTFLVN
jgi:hypothetical protein